MWHGTAIQNGRHLLHPPIHYNAERRTSASMCEQALASTHVSVALISGTADLASGAHVLRAARKRYPADTVTELPEIGHYPQVEAPNAVATALRAFLEAA